MDNWPSTLPQPDLFRRLLNYALLPYLVCKYKERIPSVTYHYDEDGHEVGYKVPAINPDVQKLDIDDFLNWEAKFANMVSLPLDFEMLLEQLT